MGCWVVVLTFADGSTFGRRVFSSTAQAAWQGLALWAASQGVTAVGFDVTGPVSAAQPHPVPLWQPSAGLCLTPATDGTTNLDRTTAPPDNAGGGTAQDKGGLEIVPPSGLPVRRRGIGASAAPRERRRRSAQLYGQPGGSPIALGGWNGDRRSASCRAQLDTPHHDPLIVNPTWPDALAFGPDALSTDVEEFAEDISRGGTVETRARWHFVSFQRMQRRNRGARC